MSWLEKTLSSLLSLLLFLLPFPTIWIYEERFLNGVKWEYGTLGIYATEILLWVSAVLFMVWYGKRRLQISNFRFQITSDRLFILACLSLISYLLLSTLWAPEPSLALQQALRIMAAFILFFMILLGPLTWRAAAGWFVAGATLQSILGIGQFLTQSTMAVKWLGLVSHPAWEAGTAVIVNDSGRWLRAYGAFPHPNILGGYLVVGLILTTLLYRIDRTNRLSAVGCQLLATAQTAALFFTFSRSAWLAWAVWMAGWLILSKTNKLFAICYQLSAFAILAIIFLPLIQTRLSGTSTNELTAQNERLAGYSEAWQLFKRSPWLGVGPGHYTLAAYALNPDRHGWEYQPVHNVPLLILTELGVIGAVLLVLAIGYRLTLYSLFLLPIIFFDHYLYSTYIGLALIAVCAALLFRQTFNTP